MRSMKSGVTDWIMSTTEHVICLFCRIFRCLTITRKKVIWRTTCSFVALFPLAGCVTTPVETLNIDSNASIVRYRKPVVSPEHQSFALFELEKGLLFFELGDYVHSDTRFAKASRVMDQIAGDEGRDVAAAVVSEDVKTFRGEPYERASLYLYRGLCKYNQGSYQDALAAFRHSLASDEETRTEEQEHREDFAISYLLAALCYARLGETDNARAMLENAKRHCPSNPYLDLEYLSKNFIALVAVGYGPTAIEGAFWKKKYYRRECPEQKLELHVDGEPIGDAEEVTDLFVQASAQTWGAADSAALGRGLGKAIFSGVIQGLTGVDPGIEEHRDLRCWRQLPLKYYVIAADLPIGNHAISLKCYDEEGEPLPRSDQIWFDVPIQPDEHDVFYFRIKENAQNIHGMELRKIGTETSEGGNT